MISDAAALEETEYDDEEHGTKKIASTVAVNMPPITRR